MSRTVDERIVQMTFKNEDFQTKAKQTISTLGKLSESLLFKNGTEGLTNVQSAANKLDFSPISSAIDGVKSNFSALEIMAIGALANIGAKIESTFTNLAKSLTIEQIGSGFNKYAEKTQSVQTLVNSTGKSVEEINGYLNKLMWYSDETSYGFTDMTKALATMVSSGGNIDNLIPMIEGMANSVAYAGKGASEFSRVIYNLNQSYGQGYLSLMDWKSVENAGAGSKQLKQILIDTAEELGTVKKGLMTVGTFNTQLSNKYITSEVMEKGFAKFASLTEAAYEAVQNGTYKTTADAIAALADSYDTVAVRAFKSAQEAKSFTEAIEATKDAVSSGWMSTFEAIFGNYDESKALWTDLTDFLYDFVVAGAETRVEILETWKSLYNPTTIGEGVEANEMLTQTQELFYALENTALTLKEKISDAWHSIFPTDIIGTATKLHESIENITDSIWSLNDYLTKTSSVWDYFTSDDSLIEFKNAEYNTLTNEIENLTDKQKQLKSALFGDDTGNSVNMYDRQIDTFTEVDGWYKQLADDCDEYILKQQKANGEVSTIFKNAFGDYTKTTFNEHDPQNFTTEIIKAGTVEAKYIEEAFGSATNLAGTAQTALYGVLEVVRAVASALRVVKEYASIIWADGIQPLIASFKPVLEDIFVIIGNIASVFTGKIQDAYNNTDKFRSVIESIRLVFEKVISVIKTVTGYLRDLTGEWASGSKEVGDSTEKFSLFKIVLDGVGAVLKTVANILNGTKSVFSAIGGVLSTVITKIKGALSSLKDVFASFWSENGATVGSAVSAGAGTYLFIQFSQILKQIKSITGKLSSGDLGIVKSIKDILGSVKEGLENFSKMKVNTEYIKSIATSLLILSAALVILASIKTEKLIQAFTAMGTAMGIMYVFIQKMNKLNIDQRNTKNLTKALTSIGLAMVEISLALKIMGSMNVSQMAIAIGGMTLVLTELGVFYKALSKMSTADILRNKTGLGSIKYVGKAMKSMGIAMIEIAAALKIMGTMNEEQMITSLKTFTVVMAELGVFIYSLTSLNKNMMSGKQFTGLGLGMIGIGLAMIELSAALKILGTLDDNSMVAALTGMGIVLAEIWAFTALINKSEKGALNFAVIAKSITGLATGLLILSGAIAVLSLIPIQNMGVALLGLGASLASFVAVAYALKKTDSTGSFAAMASSMLILAPAMLILSAALKVMSTIPLSGMAIALGGVIGVLATFAVISTLCSGIAPVMLIISGSLLVLSAAGLVGAKALIVLAEAMMIFAAVPTQTFTSLIGNMAALLLVCVEFAVVGVIMAAAAVPILAFATALTLLATGLTLISLLPIDGLAENITNFCNAIKESSTSIMEAVTAIIVAICEAIVNSVAYYMPQVVQAGFDILISLLQGIRDNIGQVTVVVAEIIAQFVIALGESVVILTDALFVTLVNTINGVAESIRSNAGDLGVALGNLAAALLEGLGSALWNCVATFGDSLFGGIKDWISGKISGNDDGSSEQAGVNMLTGVASGMNNNTNVAATSAKNINTVITDEISGSATAELKNTQTGENLITQVQTGLENKTESITTKATEIKDQITKNMDGKEEATTSGTNTMQGLLDGLSNQDYLNSLYQAGVNAANMFHAGYKSADVQASPSKRSKKEAKFTIAGLLNQFKASLPEVEESGANIADAFHESMVSALELASDSMSGDVVPVITPVLDLSEIQSGSGLIAGMFDNNSISVRSAQMISALQNGALSGSTNNNNVTLNVNFSVSNAGKDLSEADINKYSKMIANRVNEELGALI